ncbi:serine-threonine protein kinase, putative [Entamoeba histolytica HM-3:IMSS]|uniref:Serine-threonine protein kinase, putative n=1 Tax=Entamoeba histolytica HM-3:IMSS TaxID=885315 RepID=M7WAD1_ENTHI|nr:serine-threonine protein kinase, putative [Entamoeba histolytica HM-3:IMSS]
MSLVVSESKSKLSRRHKPFFARGSNSRATESSELNTGTTQTETTTTTTTLTTSHFEQMTIPTTSNEYLKTNQIELTFSKVPLILETSFKYNETILHLLPPPPKPLRQYTTLELINWIKPNAPKEFCEYILTKKINGNTIRKLTKRKFSRHGCSIKQSVELTEKIKGFDRETSFGLIVLENLNFSDCLVREMYRFTEGFKKKEIVKLNSFDYYKGITLTFMALTYYFAQNEAILTLENLKEITERINEENPFDRIVSTTQNKMIINRTFSFLKTMIESETSVFYYFKEELIDYIINCIAPGLDPIPFRCLLKFSKKENNSHCIFESDETYAGEQIILYYKEVLMPIYMLPINETITNLDKREWENGELAVTNYRMMWIPYNTTIFQDKMNCSSFYQIPIKSIQQSSLSESSKEKEKVYLIRMLSYTSQMITFGFKNIENANEVQSTVQQLEKKQYWIDEYDVYCNEICIKNNSKRIYKELKNNKDLILKPIGWNDEEYIYYSKRECSKLILIDESEKGGRIFRIEINNDKNEINNKRISENIQGEIIDLSYLDDKILEEEMNNYYRFITKIKKEQIDKMYNKLTFISDEMKKIMSCFFDIIPRFKQGYSFCFIGKEDQTESCGVSALFLIITNKYYRTFNGFLELIHTQFVCSKYFQVVYSKGYHPFNFCIFLHMINCIMYSYPTIFEFTPYLLSFLTYHTFSHRFSTISSQKNPTQSLYSYLLNHKIQFIKSDFDNFAFDIMEYWPQSIVLLQPNLFIDFINYTKDKNPILSIQSNSSIDLSNYYLTSFPHYLWQKIQKEQIQVMNLNGNQIPFIPNEIVTLPNLKELQMKNNTIQYIPQWHLYHLTNLTFLDISERPNNEASQYEMITFDILCHLKYLNISNRPLSPDISFPLSIRTIVATNSFETLPNKMTKLTNLISLNLSYNPKINTNQVLQLNKLKTLKMSYCNKTRIPNLISTMTNLTLLDFSYNIMKGLPLDLFNLTNLSILDVSHNNLQYLSQLHTKLIQLQTLKIDGNSDIKIPQTQKDHIKSIPQIQTTIFETPLHILSDNKGIDLFKKFYSEFKNSKSDNIKLYEQLPIDDEPKAHHFLLQYHDFNNRIGFIPPISDCYIIILSFDRWRSVLSHWKYYLQRVLPNDESIKMRIMFFVENKKTAEDQSAVDSIKKQLLPWQSDVIVLTLKSKKKLNIESKLKKLISDFKVIPNVYNESILKVAKEIKMATFDPPVIKEGQLYKIINQFNLEGNFHTIINALHQLGVIISVSRSIDKKQRVENKINMYNLLSLNSTNSNLVIVDLSIFENINFYLEKQAQNGFGFIENIKEIIHSYRGMSPDTINVIMYFIQMFYDVFIVSDDFLNKFGLQEKYEEFVSVHSITRIDILSSLYSHQINKLPTKRSKFNHMINRSLSTAIEIPSFSQEDEIHSTCRTPAASTSQPIHISKTLYFQPRLLPHIEPITLNEYWPKFHDTKEMDFGRVINFQYIPPIYFAYFIFIALIEGLSITKVFMNQCILTKIAYEQHFYFYIECNEHQFTIRTRYRAATVNSVLVAAELMEVLLDSFYKIHDELFPTLEYDELILCPTCLILGVDKCSAIPLKEINEAILKNKEVISFGECHTCMVSTCSLDLSLKDLRKKQQNKLFSVEINRSELTNENLLGIGSTAKVYSTIYNNKKAAIKLFSFEPSQFSSEKGKGGAAHLVSKSITELKREICIMNLIESPYILKLYGISFDPLALVMDICDKGDLHEYIRNKNNDLSWPIMLRFAYQIASGMASLHKELIIHRDLKSPNILIKTNQQGELTCVISDFGLSGTYNEEEKYFVDNPRWVAPEVLINKPFTLAADVYSFAIILWELLAREEPFNDFKFPSQLRTSIITGLRPTIPNSPYIRYKELIQKCWSQDPILRPPFSEIVDKLSLFRKMVEKEFEILPVS